MKFHILSDLHMSTGTLVVPESDADLVVLAGDLARPREAIAWASSLGKPALYVPGNHEFYGGSLDGTASLLRELCEGTQVSLLDRDQLVLGGVRVLGATLWTDFMLFGSGEKRAAAIDAAQRFMRDFSRIRIEEGGQALFTPEHCALLFARDAAWLARTLAEPFDGPTVVITHHAPSRGSIHPRFADSLINAAFVSDAEYLIEGAAVRLWIHGHTHDSFDYMVDRTRVVCNPRGYLKDGVNENAAFDPGLVIEVT